MSDLERLREEVLRLKKETADRDWGMKKTNDGIKILYKELERKTKELQKLDQMKSDFVSMVSHELRTPITIIKESICQIVDGLAGKVTGEQSKLLVMALSNIDRLGRIINSLLDISKLEAGKITLHKEKIELVSLVHDAVENFKPAFDKKKIEVRTHFSASAMYTMADRDKIVQVLVNLLGNALKFTEQGQITVSAVEKDHGIECSVIDTGCGISKDNLPKVFDKFQQFGRRSGPGEKGTGLGLAISKALVELHGGDIWVESKLHEGSLFTFTLPKEQVLY